MMDTKIKRCLALILALIMIFALSACGNKDSNVDAEVAGEPAAEVKEDPVELVFYMVGSAQPDFDQVMEEVNAMLLEDINATLDVRFIDWGELGEKYPMVLASGEQVDLIFARSGWKDFASKGAFMPLEDLAKEYAPNMYAFLTENTEYYKGAVVNDTLYMIPPDFVEVNVSGVAIRGDIREKYNLPEIDSVEDYIEFLRVVKENEPGFNVLADAVDAIPFYGETAAWTTCGVFWLKFDNAGDVNDLAFMYENDDFVKFYSEIRSAYEDGLIQKDVLMSQADSWVEFKEGTMASGLVNIKNFTTEYGQIMEAHPDWNIEFYDLSSNVAKIINPVTGGMAIPVSAKYPEKAMQIIELLNTNEKYWYLTTYGIEGKHYEIVDGVYKYADGVTAETTGFAPDSFGWYWRNTARMLPTENDWPEGKAMTAEIADNSVGSQLLGFTFDPTPVEAEIATINAIIKEYDKALSWGAVDLDATLETLIKQAEAAGLEKVRTEMIDQVQEFLANK